MSERTYILTLVGHDPSGDAGITSNNKTFEARGLYGLSVCTAITVQNDSRFKQCTWISTNTILAQIETLFDPIFNASAGFDFHSNEEQVPLNSVWKQCYIITPNYTEIQRLYPQLDVEETPEQISSLTNIYLKGGHRKDKKDWDELYHSGIVVTSIPSITAEVSEKHGSGCGLFSALEANIALRVVLRDACTLAKNFTEVFLNSHTALLGIHIPKQQNHDT